MGKSTLLFCNKLYLEGRICDLRLMNLWVSRFFFVGFNKWHCHNPLQVHMQPFQIIRIRLFYNVWTITFFMTLKSSLRFIKMQRYEITTHRLHQIYTKTYKNHTNALQKSCNGAYRIRSSSRNTTRSVTQLLFCI